MENTPTPRPTAVAESTDGARDLDWLDEAYLDDQDRLSAALARFDDDAAREIRAESEERSVADADGFEWRILVPHHALEPKPDYRFWRRYKRYTSGDDFIIIRRSRFAEDPSLSQSYAEKAGGSGFLPWVVKQSEPLAYIAAVTVAVGLWLLLGDFIGSLPGVAILAAMVLLAAGLWVSTVWLAGVRYREAQRLSHLTRAAAIGVTAAVPWVATIEVSAMTIAGRVALSAAVVTAAAAMSFWKRRSPFTYFITLGAWLVALGSTAAVISEALYDSPDQVASAQLGVLIATAVAFPIATRTARLRWIPPAITILSAAAVWTVLITGTGKPTDLHVFNTVVLGAIAAVSAFTSGRALRPQLRNVHWIGAGSIAAVSILIALTKANWDWLADVPLPVVLVTVGSVTLVGIAVVIRVAVKRVGSGPGDHRSVDEQ